MKLRIVTILLCVLFAVSSLVGCGGKPTGPASSDAASGSGLTDEPVSEPTEEPEPEPTEEPEPEPTEEPEPEPTEEPEPEPTEEPEPELSELGKLGLQDEPYDYFGVQVYLPLEYSRPDDVDSIYQICRSTAPLSSSPLINFISMDGMTPFSNPEYKNEEHLLDLYSLYDVDGFDTYADVTISGYEAQIATCSFRSNQDNLLPQVIVRIFLPEYWITIHYSSSDDGTFSDAYLESLARLSVAGGDGTVGVSLPESSGGDRDLYFTDQGEFEYGGFAFPLPDAFVSVIETDTGLYVVTEDYPQIEDTVFFYEEPSAITTDMLTREVFEDYIFGSFPDVETLDRYEQLTIDGADIVYVTARLPSTDGSVEAKVCFAYLLTGEKTISVSLASISGDYLDQFCEGLGSIRMVQ